MPQLENKLGQHDMQGLALAEVAHHGHHGHHGEHDQQGLALAPNVMSLNISLARLSSQGLAGSPDC